MQTPSLQTFEYALFDIDASRLEESYQMLCNMNANCNEGRAKIVKYTARKEAFRDAKYVINAIQVGGYEPCTVTDFEIPQQFGLQQTIADTVGVGGIFRALRTIPVMLEFMRDMEEVCPDTLFLNYTNPMAMLTMAMLKSSKIQTIGICHSVQICVPQLLARLGLPMDGLQYKIAGINHMAWLLEITRNGEDYYPQIKQRAMEGPILKPYTKEILKAYPQFLYPDYPFTPDQHDDLVRFEIMKQFGYYVTESSEHNAEFMPYFIKKSHPELIEKYKIPLNEYPRRCEIQIAHWSELGKQLVEDETLTHQRTHEYPSYILEALETGRAFTFAGNVMNTGLIDNLPQDCCVEVPCVADRSGVHPCHVGEIPPQLAALNCSNIGMQQLTVKAALTHERAAIYQAALLDPHTSAELTIEEIHAMVDALILAHGSWLPTYH